MTSGLISENCENVWSECEKFVIAMDLNFVWFL